jgi:iron(III) transport system ATP-binding protein
LADFGVKSPGGERVDIAGATKRFGDKAALAGVHLHVEPGTLLVLLGPSGSGKTTLLRCLAGIERLSEGTIAIGGRTVAAPGVHLPPEKRHLAMVFQDYALWPHMTALQNVAFPLRQLRIPAGEARKRATEMLEAVGLAKLSGRYPNELSGGEQQRVALARALVGGVGLLLFDEPLSNLDADMREQLRLAIATLTRDRGATSVYITHDQAEAFALADRVGVLRDGRLVQLGTPEEIYHQPANPFVARFTGTCAEAPVRLVGDAPTRRAGAGTPSLVEAALAGQEGARVTATLARAVPAGVPMQMFVRPSAVQIVHPGEGQLLARVRDVAFAGRGYEHALVAGGDLFFTKVFSERRWPRSATVGVRLAPEGCLVLPEASVAGTAEEDEAACAAELALAYPEGQPAQTEGNGHSGQ